MADDNNSRPMLLQEKEVLLEEIRRLNSLVRSEGEKVSKRLLRHVFFCKVLRQKEVSFLLEFLSLSWKDRYLYHGPVTWRSSFMKLLRVALRDSTDERTSVTFGTSSETVVTLSGSPRPRLFDWYVLHFCWANVGLPFLAAKTWSGEGQTCSWSRLGSRTFSASNSRQNPAAGREVDVGSPAYGTNQTDKPSEHAVEKVSFVSFRTSHLEQNRLCAAW